MVLRLLEFRFLCAAIFLASISLLLTAIYIEPFASMDPCPMCMMQRVVFGAVAGVAAVAWLHHPQSKAKQIYLVALALISVGGMYLAGRQIWLQHLPPDQVPACGPPLDYMLDVFPLLEVIQMALTGTGDCAKVQWQFLGLSIPGWSLVAFSAFMVSSVTSLLVSSRHPN